MPNPILIPIAFRLMIAAAAGIAGLLGAALAVLRVKSDPEEHVEIKHGGPPLNNTTSSAEAKEFLRKEVRENPELARNMSAKHKQQLGIDDES